MQWAVEMQLLKIHRSTDMNGWLYSLVTSPPAKQPPILCCVVTPNSWGSSVWNFLMPRILRCFLDLWIMCELPVSSCGTVELFRYGDPAVGGITSSPNVS
jgi:hypothetical protein